jgi:polar amino acid transport system substrate-binding protein
MRLPGALLVALSLSCLTVSTAAAAGSCAVAAPRNLANTGKLTFGTGSPPPSPGVKPINVTGFEFDLAEALAQQICLKPDYVVLAFAGLFPGLDAHKFDAAIASIGITAQREQSFAFVPYFLGGIRLMVSKSSGLYFQNEADVCGHSIAVLAGSVEAHDIDKYKPSCPGDKPMDVHIMPSNNEIVEQLRKGTVQVAFLDWAPVSDIIARNPDDFALGSPILTGEPPGEPRHRIGIMVRKDDSEMKQALAAALARLQADGTYDKLLAKWDLSEGDIRKAG